MRDLMTGERHPKDLARRNKQARDERRAFRRYARHVASGWAFAPSGVNELTDDILGAIDKAVERVRTRLEARIHTLEVALFELCDAARDDSKMRLHLATERARDVLVTGEE